MDRDRRQQPRYVLRTSVRVPVGDGTLQRETTTVNISVGGLCFELSEPLPRATTLQVDLLLSDGATLRLDAVVRHATRGGTSVPGARDGEQPFYLVGVEFTAISDEQRAVIEEHLRSLDEEQA